MSQRNNLETALSAGGLSQSDYFDHRFRNVENGSGASMQRSKFTEVLDPGLGIQMVPMNSPLSPVTVQKISYQPKVTDIYHI